MKNNKNSSYKNYFYNDNFDSLINDFNNDKSMALFLGAGINISKGNGLDWNNLLDSLFKEALTFLSIEKNIKGQALYDIQNIFKDKGEEIQEIRAKIPYWTDLHRLAKNEFTALMKASIIKEIMGRNYISSIQTFLYSQCNRIVLEEAFNRYYSTENREPGEYYTLFQIARLIMLYPNIRAVITYNFDNFLSEAIQILDQNRDKFFTPEEKRICRKKIEVKEISSASLNTDLNTFTLPVYHIHGYIAPPNELIVNNENDIVLSMDEFYENVNDVFSWQTTTQIHFLSHFTCIFAGSSLSDITGQRMIYNAHMQNSLRKIYYLSAASTGGFDNPHYKESYLKLQNIKNSFFASYGLSPCFEEEGYDVLYKRFNEIIDELIKNK